MLNVNSKYQYQYVRSNIKGLWIDQSPLIFIGLLVPKFDNCFQTYKDTIVSGWSNDLERSFRL